MSKYEHPRFTRTDMTTILAESQIAAVTDNDFKNPTPEFVSDLSTRLLIYLDTLHEEEQGQLEFSALEQLENPDFHIGSVQIMNLYSRMREVVASVDCPMKFTLKDFIKPDAARTEFFVSAILNFCLYKDTKMNLLRPIVEDLTLLDEQRKEWEAKITQLNEEIENYNDTRGRELPLVQELDAKVKELRQTIAGLNSQQMSLKATFRERKDRIGEMDMESKEAEFSLVQIVQENRDLCSKIVQSPDKLQRALEEKRSIREEAKNAERSAMQSFREKTALHEIYTKACKKVSKHFAQMQTMHKQVETAKTIEEEYKALQGRLSNDEVLDKSHDAKLVERQGKAEQLDESRKKLEKERDLKYEEATRELNDVKLNVESRRRDLEAGQRNIEAVVAEVDANALKTNLVKESGAAKLEELVGKGEEIVKQLQQRTKSIGLLLPMIG
ncbi:Nuf2 domain-containing protein [Cephalotus follicularis]|uniref:Nuf2 domain-containing protein n=1 Tax=Cephalotus follicularis TaxID=3775 RepID=A0A1Q3AZL2_CEPFO|nr:Nuf2 domain-containing protein [Cephalotus follicularis]